MAGRLALTALLLLLTLPGSTAAAAPCPADPDDPEGTGDRVARVGYDRVLDDPLTHSVVIVCDRRTGRHWRLRRSVLRMGTGPARGRLVTDAYAAGRYVAWTETRAAGRGRFPARAVLARLRDGRRLRAVRLPRASGTPPVPVAIAVTSRGELGALDIDGLVVARPGRPASRVVHEPTVPGILVVDDDRTFAWWSRRVRVFDLPRPPDPSCRRRDGSQVLLPSPEALVTARTFAFGRVVRACLWAQPRELVVGAPEPGRGATPTPEPLAVGHGFLAVAEVAKERYGHCVSAVLRTIDLRTGTTRRAVDLLSLPAWPASFCPPTLPVANGVVITSAGAVSWISAVPDGRVVLAGGADGLVHVLDRGDVDALRADGDRLVWTNGGTQRSAVP